MILQLVLILVLAPFIQGVIGTVRARLSGRPGSPPWQPYRDLRKLVRKEHRTARSSSRWLQATPGLTLGIALSIVLLIPPVVGLKSALLPFDAILLAFLFALGRAALLVTALDTGSQFGAIGVGRELTFAAITEAPLVLALLGGAVLGRSSPLHANESYVLGSLLAGSALFLVLLFESARVPVDNQETHYELTMIHEALLLEFSGANLAILQYASYLRQAALVALLAFVLSGTGIPDVLALLIVVAAIPFVEAFQAKLRLFEVPQLASTATILAIAAIGFDLIGAGR